MADYTGTDGDDTFVGTDQAERIVGLGGADNLDGGGGDDTIEGGDGNDTLSGGDGNDVIYGGDSFATTFAHDNDHIDGGAGDDVLYGGNGDDVILGGIGNDVIVEGQGGNNDLSGGDGNDQISVSGGFGAIIYTNTVSGGDGNDTIQFEHSNGTVSGGAGADQIRVASGTMSVDGGDGNDWLVLGSTLFQNDGIQTLTGGAGADLFTIGQSSFGNERDRITDFNAAEGDTLGIGAVSGRTYINNYAYLFGGELPASSLTFGTALPSPSVQDATKFAQVFYVHSGGDTFLMIDSNGNFTFDQSDLCVQFTGTINFAPENFEFDTFRARVGTDASDTMIGGSGDDLLYGLGGNDILQGGLGFNFLYGGSGDDLLQGGAWSETLDGGDGNDTIYGGGDDGGAGAVDHIIGGAGNDTIHDEGFHAQVDAGDGDDVVIGGDLIDGGNGNDYLDGQDGQNFITGDAGDDIVFGGASESSLYGGTGDDLIYAGTGTDRINGGGENDTLSYARMTAGVTVSLLINGDYQQTGASGADNITGIRNLTGTDYADTLTGDAGANRINGGAGNDILDGGAGADTMIGGAGNDTFVVDNVGDVVIENANEGTDTVESLVSYTLSANVENLTLTGTGDTSATGNASVNVITGNSGNNALVGGGGADTLIGGAGDDIYTVSDAATVIVEAAGGGNDTVKSSVSYTLTAGAEIETARLIGTGNIDLTGNAIHQVLIGNTGNNTLDGGGGGDRMKGGAGNDTYIVRSSADAIVEVAGDGDDTVKAAVSYTLGAAAQVEHLYTVDALATTAIDLTGNDYSHDIQGNAGVNVLTGGSGNDTLSGNGGADTLIGGAGDDIYSVTDAGTTIVEAAGGGNDTVKAFVSYTLTAGAEIETARLIGTANLDLTGNELHQVLIGNTGNNTLDGGGGGDRMKGGGGDDTYIVRSSADAIVEVAGDGNDTAKAAVSYTLGAAAQVEHLFTIDTSATTAINLTGNDYSHDIQGNAGANVLTGGSGADVLQGFAGNDTLIGGGGADTFHGGDGDDVITVVSNDYVAGEVYDGGAGNDALYFFSTGSLDISNSMITGIETLNFNTQPNDATLSLTLAQLAGFTQILTTNSLTLTTGGAISFAGKTLDSPINLAAADTSVDLTGVVQVYSPSVINGNSGNDTLTGSAGSDKLSGGAGNDLINGGAGNDTLTGGAGADKFVFDHGTGLDTVGDFASGTDKLDLSAFFTTFAQVQAALHDVGGSDALIDLGGNDGVRLSGFHAAQLQAGDVILGGSGQASLTIGKTSMQADTEMKHDPDMAHAAMLHIWVNEAAFATL